MPDSTHSVHDWRDGTVRLADRAIVLHGDPEDTLQGDLARIRARRWLKKQMPEASAEQLDVAIDIAWEGVPRP